jgi:hypothetical protein
MKLEFHRETCPLNGVALARYIRAGWPAFRQSAGLALVRDYRKLSSDRLNLSLVRYLVQAVALLLRGLVAVQEASYPGCISMKCRESGLRCLGSPAEVHHV